MDMWSTGCIFAELLSLIKENIDQNIKNGQSNNPILFPGVSCFPLSPRHFKDPWKNENDQLNMIFDLIGTPTMKDIVNIEDKQARMYLTNKIIPKNKKRKDFKFKFPICDVNTLDLLEQFLFFDVAKRITAEKALKHKFFHDIRDHTVEARNPRTKFEFEDNDDITGKMLTDLIVKEIDFYKKKHDNTPSLASETLQSRAVSAITSASKSEMV